jgi:3-deoxy-manno-octulosonate cytidylyltransferase (CMP-KDO synthetase)
MIEHVYKRAELSDIVEATFVATPDEEVRDAMMSFGGKAILTGEHTRGTDRVAEAAQEFDAHVIVIFHTHEPLITQEMADNVFERVIGEISEIPAVNVTWQIQQVAAFRNLNNVKMVSDLSGDAVLVSRFSITNNTRSSVTLLSIIRSASL